MGQMFPSSMFSCGLLIWVVLWMLFNSLIIIIQAAMMLPTDNIQLEDFQLWHVKQCEDKRLQPVH